MPKYNVAVDRTLTTNMWVEADNEEEAHTLALESLDDQTDWGDPYDQVMDVFTEAEYIEEYGEID